MGCECQTENAGTGFDLARMQALASNDSSLYWYVQGVRTGMQIRAAEQQKWSRIGVILALAFGTITFMHRFIDAE